MKKTWSSKQNVEYAHHVVTVHVHRMYSDIFVVEYDANAFTIAEIIDHPFGLKSSVSLLCSK